MTLPQFLIIGAMKAGTTTLYEDLNAVPGLYLPPQKEPEDLIHPQVETEQGQAIYAAKFAAAPQGAICGEASTAYSKLPTYPDVAARALRVLGAETKLIYLTRDPIKRMVSQYHHLWGLGLETRGLNKALLEDETYLAYSDYARQLAPWQASFGAGQILVLPFETYLEDRATCLGEICDFLGVAPPSDVAETHRNASEGKRVARPGSLMSRFARSRVYLYRIKPLLPTRWRDRVKAALLPKARRQAETLTPETEAELRRRLDGL